MTTDSSSTTERLESATRRVTRARRTLEAAETGLRAGERVSRRADELRGHPLVPALAFALVLGLIAVVILLVRKGRRSENG